MKITCTGHSGFLAEMKDCNIIFDYYTDKTGVITPGLFNNKRTYVFVSHSHGDHYNKEIFRWGRPGEVTYILDAGINAGSIAGDVVYLTEGAETKAHGLYAKAYGSTDEGLSFLVIAEGVTLFHAGDLNCWYWEDESTPEELRADKEAYLRIIGGLAEDNKKAGRVIDVAFFPEDPRLGRHKSLGLELFGEAVKPGLIIPMHYPGNEGLVWEIGAEG